MSTPFNLELLQGHQIYLSLIKGPAKVKELIGKEDVAFIRPDMVCSISHILYAANKAMHNQVHNQMKTKNINSELLYNLSPSKGVGDCLKTMGADDKSEYILIAKFDRPYLNNNLGQEVDLNQLSSLAQLDQIFQTFQIEEQEFEIDFDVTNAVISRLAIKDLK